LLRTLLINTGSNVLVMIVKIVLTFLMTPLFVHNLGNYDYGLWEMVGAVLGYMGMLDLGIKPAISVYAARFRAQEDADNLQTVFASTFIFMVGIGVLIAVILACWGLFFSGSMAPEGEQTLKYTLFMLILAGQMLIVFPGYVAESFLEGFQKYHIKNNITIINSLLGAGAFISLATPENSLLLLAAINGIGLGVKYVLFFLLLAKPTHGAVSYKPGRFSPKMLKEMLRFSLKSFIQGLATRMESFTDTLVIGSFLGPAIVPFYSIPQSLVRYIQTLGWTLSHAFMPLFSDLAARSRHEEIQEIYLVASKVVVGVVLALGTGVIILATPFLAVWIGPEYTSHSDVIVPLLVIFTILPLLNPFSSRYLTAINRHGVFAKWMPVSALSNLLLSILLVEPYGLVGVACASLIPSLFLQPALLVYTCRQLGLPVQKYLKTCLLPLALPLVIMGTFISLVRWQLPLDSYFMLGATVVGGGVLYMTNFWFFSFTGAERLFVGERLRKRFL
jgi:O-antigen/teichoic acid export membrane protein